MKKAVNILFLVFAAAFVVFQFFQIERTNPPIVEGDTLEAALAVPPDISLILGRSCNDCHTHKTIYPWYAYIQPSGWFLRDHVDTGRSRLNLSIFNTYDAKKKIKKLEEICEQVEYGEMPLPSYLWLHRTARLSDSEAKALCDWANAELAKFAK